MAASRLDSHLVHGTEAVYYFANLIDQNEEDYLIRKVRQHASFLVIAGAEQRCDHSDRSVSTAEMETPP